MHPSVDLCIQRPSICSSCYLLLNHWAEFNETCHMTSPHGMGVREQHYFSVCPSMCPGCMTSCLSHSLLLNQWAKNQACYMTSPHGKSVREQHYFSMSPSVRASGICLSVCLSVMLSYPKPMGGNEPNLLHDLASKMVSGLEIFLQCKPLFSHIFLQSIQ